MKRSDRLMQLIQLLRDDRMHRAEDLAKALNVSLRTMYRDLDTLAASGVPIEGERGLGYKVTADITLPPLNLTMTEVEVLHLGLLSVSQGGDDELAEAAKSLSAKLEAVMPEDRSRAPEGYSFATYPFADAAKGFKHLPVIRQAIRTRQKLEVTRDGQDRTLRPLQLDYWGRLWTCAAWCETTKDFDELRVDQIETIRILPSLFVEEAGKSLSDFNAIKLNQSSSDPINSRRRHPRSKPV